MLLEVEKRLKGSYRSALLQELLTNSIHFPLANIILEFLLEGSAEYLRQPDFYALSIACLAQTFVLGTWRYRGAAHRLLGNLLGPGVYTLIEVFFEGTDFFTSPYHIAYWLFAILIGGLQEWREQRAGTLANLLTIVEHLIRTSIVLVMYIIFETLTRTEYQAFWVFWADRSHVYITVVVLLLGFVIGFANVTANRYVAMLSETAAQLKVYAEWFLGRELLSAAIQDATVLSLQRRQRAVLFMDIRGFTAWSEQNSPDVVVKMLNAYFETAEQVWRAANVIKVKHTGDEIMAVLPTASDACQMALQLNANIRTFLRAYNLSAGLGIHQGDLVEGIIGSKQVKMYDIIGDTVNTAKRICDQAKGGEILLSEAIYHALDQTKITLTESRLITAKGKNEPLHVFVLQREKEIAPF